MRVIDAFMFYSEFDVLELRLRELGDVVDTFVLVEATTTFAGDPKPLFFRRESSRFLQSGHKIVHFAVDDLPARRRTNRWLSEITQRNALRTAVRCLPEPLTEDDLVLISDVDEVPRRATIVHLRAAPPTDEIVALEMKNSSYQLNLRAGKSDAARAVRWGVLELLTPQEIRRARTTRTLADAGWHLSYLAPRGEIVEKIELKVKSFAHKELDNAVVLDRRRLERMVRARLWFVPGQPIALEVVPVDESFPLAVRENPDRWEPFLVPVNRWPALDRLWYLVTRLTAIGVLNGRRVRRRLGTMTAGRGLCKGRRMRRLSRSRSTR